jgi:hypothetical protein
MVVAPLYAPLLELNGMVTLKRLALGPLVLSQPLKLIVMLADRELPELIFPTDSGKATGLVITGVHAVPENIVRLIPSIRAAVAVPVLLLLLLSEMVQVRAAMFEPVLLEMLAVRFGVLTKLA